MEDNGIFKEIENWESVIMTKQEIRIKALELAVLRINGQFISKSGRVLRSAIRTAEYYERFLNGESADKIDNEMSADAKLWN